MKKLQRGFTLIEAVITIGLFVIIMITFFALYDGYSKVYVSQQGLFNIAGSASSLMNETNTMVMQADQVVASHTFAGIGYTTGAETLVLELPSITASGDIVNGKFDYVAIYKSGSKAYRILAADSTSSRRNETKEFSDTISSLNFTYNNLSPPEITKVDVDITTQAVSGHQTQTYHLHQQVYLRND